MNKKNFNEVMEVFGSFEEEVRRGGGMSAMLTISYFLNKESQSKQIASGGSG